MFVRKIGMVKIAMALLLMAGAAAASYAQRPGRFAGPGGPGRPGPAGIAGLGPRIAQELGLTDEQKQQMQNYLQDARSQMEVLRNDTTLTPEQRRAQVRQIRENTQARLKSVLTPAQQAKAEELRAQARQKRQERSEQMLDRRLERMTSELGLSSSQSETIRSLTEQARTQARTVRENSALTQEQKIQQLRALRTDMRNQINSTLTADQKAKLDQLREQARNRMQQRGRGPGGRGPGARGQRGPGSGMGL